MNITPLKEKLKVHQSCVLICLGRELRGQFAEREGVHHAFRNEGPVCRMETWSDNMT